MCCLYTKHISRVVRNSLFFSPVYVAGLCALSTRAEGVKVKELIITPVAMSVHALLVAASGPAPQVRLHGFNRTTFYN